MYELKNGSARLINAIYNRNDNPGFIQNLARQLDYIPSQLQQDVQALNDYYEQTKDGIQ